MAARIGTRPELRNTASPTARLLPFHRHALTHVLITGGGTDARREQALAIHAESVLRSGSFVGVDCAAEAPRLERALQAWLMDSFDSSDPSLMASERGTLFLDRIETLPPRAQRQLLALVTQRMGSTVALDRRWGGRLICGAQGDLDAAVADGRFLLPLLDCLDKARLSLDGVRRGGAA